MKVNKATQTSNSSKKVVSSVLWKKVMSSVHSSTQINMTIINLIHHGKTQTMHPLYLVERSWTYIPSFIYHTFHSSWTSGSLFLMCLLILFYKWLSSLHPYIFSFCFCFSLSLSVSLTPVLPYRKKQRKTLSS